MKRILLIICTFSTFVFSQIATTIRFDEFTINSTTNEIQVTRQSNINLIMSSKLVVQHTASNGYKVKFILTKADNTLINEF